MAFPPLNIFSQNCLPDESLAQLKEWLPYAKVTEGPDGTWSEVEGTWKRGLLKKSLRLRVTHSPEYYAGEGWGTQRAGMAGYFSRFPGAEAMPELFDYLRGLNFALNFILDPDPVDDDPRLKLVYAMAQLVDGVIFLPGKLLDSHGRVILAGDGENDAAAQVPINQAQTREQLTQSLLEAVSEDEDETVEPPSQKQVTARLILMAALVQRGFLEGEGGREVGKRSSRAGICGEGYDGVGGGGAVGKGGLGVPDWATP